MPEQIQTEKINTNDDLPGLLKAASMNLDMPKNVDRSQGHDRMAVAQAQATLALAIGQARVADALDLANLIQARALGAFDSAEEYKATRDKIRELAGLPVSKVA